MASPSSVNMIPDLNESLDAQLHQPLVIPQNEGMLTQRSDIEALYESLALCSRTTSSVQNIALRLKARTTEVRAKNSYNPYRVLKAVFGISSSFTRS